MEPNTINLTIYIDSLILKVLEAPGYQKLNEEERGKLANNLESHFQEMIMESFLNRLSDEEAKNIEASIKKPEEFDKKMSEYSLKIPGLANDIEERLNREIEVMKSLAE